MNRATIFALLVVLAGVATSLPVGAAAPDLGGVGAPSVPVIGQPVADDAHENVELMRLEVEPYMDRGDNHDAYITLAFQNTADRKYRIEFDVHPIDDKGITYEEKQHYMIVEPNSGNSHIMDWYDDTNKEEWFVDAKVTYRVCSPVVIGKDCSDEVVADYGG